MQPLRRKSKRVHSVSRVNLHRLYIAPLHPWQWPTRPWSRLHIDFAGPIDSKMYLVVIQGRIQDL